MKLAVLGGGGVRSLMLARSIVRRAEALSIDHVVFMDNDERKLATFGRMSRRVANLLSPDLRFDITADAAEAVRSADFVITTLRVGGDGARIPDERIALSHGVLGQETTGAGGFSMAMRTIPALAGYCDLIGKTAKKDVMVFNFTNPSGLVTQAMRDLGHDFVYGICDAPSGFLRQVAGLCGVGAGDVTSECFGLNHLSYFRSVKVRGREMVPALLADPRLYRDTEMRYFSPELAQHVGMLLNEYLYYYYYREQAVRNITSAGQTRGEAIREVNEGMMAALGEMDVEREFDRALRVYSDFMHRREASYMANETTKVREIAKREAPLFDIHEPDDGGYAGVALAFVEAMRTGREGEMVLSVPNRGAIPFLADDDVVEVTCAIGPGGAAPKPAGGGAPAPVVNLIRSVKLYERLAAQAILQRDRKTAVDALLVHPLVNSYSLAKSLTDAYIEANRPYCGVWR